MIGSLELSMRTLLCARRCLRQPRLLSHFTIDSCEMLCKCQAKESFSTATTHLPTTMTMAAQLSSRALEAALLRPLWRKRLEWQTVASSVMDAARLVETSRMGQRPSHRPKRLCGHQCATEEEA